MHNVCMFSMAHIAQHYTVPMVVHKQMKESSIFFYMCHKWLQVVSTDFILNLWHPVPAVDRCKCKSAKAPSRTATTMLNSNTDCSLNEALMFDRAWTFALSAGGEKFGDGTLVYLLHP